MNKKIAEFTNQQFLAELAQRILHNRLEPDGCFNCQTPFQNHRNEAINFNLWDNEWEDTTKPDYTGARTNLNY